MVYTIEQLGRVAEKYGLHTVWVFDSYARNEKTHDRTG